MKQLFVFLAIALLCSGLTLETDTSSGFLGKSEVSQEAIDVNEAETNPDIKAHLAYGVEQLLKVLLTQNKIDNANFIVKKVNSITKEPAGKAINYQFVIDLDNSQGTTIKATLIIQYKATGERTLGGYTYSMTKRVVTTTVTSPDENAWVEVSLAQYQADSTISGALEYAIENSILEASKKGELELDTYQIVNINNVYKQTVNTFTFYKYAVDLTNKKGTSITLSCQVAINQKTGERILRFYHYIATSTLYAERIKIVTSNEGFTQVVSGEISTNTEIQVAQNYGVQQIIQLIISEGKVTVSNFDLTSVKNCMRRIVGQWTFYKFEVELTNSQGIVVVATFTVRCSTGAKTCDLAGFSYTISGQSTDGDNTKDSQYIVCDVADAKGDQETKNALEAGISQIIDKAYSSGKITSNTFKLTTVISIYKKITSSGIYYKFSCTLEDDEGAIMTLTFTVKYIIKTGKTEATAYNYQVRSASKEPGTFTSVDISKITSDDQAQAAIKYAVSEVIKSASSKNRIEDLDFTISKYTSVEKSITKLYVFYRCTIILVNNIGGSITATFTVRMHLKTGACEVTSLNYKYAESDTDNDSDYTEVDASKIDTDTDIKTCAQYGIKQVITKITSEKTIENTDFTIYKVSSIKVKRSGLWITCQFELILTNDEGWTITAKFTVRCNTSSGSCTLKSLSYKSSYDGSWADNLKYTDVDTTKATSDSQLQTAVNFGISEISSNYAAKAKVTKNLSFIVSKYNSIKRAVTKTYAFYIFDVELSNNAGTIITATFSVKCTIKSGKCELTSSSYKYTTKKISTEDESDYTDDDEEDGTYSTIDSTQVTSNTDVKTAVNYGIAEITKKVAKKQSISSSTFTISKVNTIWRKTTLKYTYFKFDLILVNGDGWTITTTFTIRFTLKSGDCKLQSYKYKVTYVEPAEKTITESDINKDDDAKAAMEYGVNEVQKRLQNQGIIKVLNFKISKVEEGKVKKTKTSTNYTFNLELTNVDKFVVKISITVSSDVKTKEKNLTAWNLRGTANAAGAVANAVERTTSSIISSVKSWFSL